MMSFLRNCAWFIAFLANAVSAYAASPVSNVGTAIVNDGEVTAEMRAGYSWDESGSKSSDDRFRLRQHLDYGLNDWYALRIVSGQDKRSGDAMEHSSFSIENRFQLIERRNHGWDGGVRFIYEHKDGDKKPDELDIRLMAQVPFGSDNQWEFRHNTVMVHELGEDNRAGLLLELRNQVTRKIPAPDYLKSLRIGLEMFNDIGRVNDNSSFEQQDHQMGPVLKASFDSGLYMQTGYRTALSDDGTDHLVKFFIGQKF